QTGREAQLNRAQVHLKLGELGMEREDYAQATEDLSVCLSLQSSLLAPDDRLLAETQYQLGVSALLAQRHGVAVKHFCLARDIIKSRLDSLGETGDERERRDLRLLLPELAERIQDARDSATHQLLTTTTDSASAFSKTADDDTSSSSAAAPTSSSSAAAPTSSSAAAASSSSSAAAASSSSEAFGTRQPSAATSSSAAAASSSAAAASAAASSAAASSSAAAGATSAAASSSSATSSSAAAATSAAASSSSAGASSAAAGAASSAVASPTSSSAAASAARAALSASAPVGVSNINHLVRRKNKLEESETRDGDSDKKRIKLQNGDSEVTSSAKQEATPTSEESK
ncbi:unnamed protein product, partial [Lampetra planeri]